MSKKGRGRAHGKAKAFDLETDETVQDKYERYARVLRVVDGDTLELLVDLGFGNWHQDKFRLAGVDTPEKYGVKKASDEYKAGVAASEFTRAWIEEHAEIEEYETPLGRSKFPMVVIRTFDAGKGKYGRWIASVHRIDGEGESLNEALIRTGHAEAVNY